MRRIADRIKANVATALGVCLLGGSLVGMNPFAFSAEPTSTVPAMDISNSWHQVESKPGNCKVKFPAVAEHVSEVMKVDDAGTELKYDAYISSSATDSVYMLLIAQYPDFVDEQFAQMSLEAFLNGILTHGGGAQLLFADLVLVQGHEGLDFFIRTGPNYFKGRAVMVKNQLYLMAMECKISDYDENHYDAFVNSFLLAN